MSTCDMCDTTLRLSRVPFVLLLFETLIFIQSWQTASATDTDTLLSESNGNAMDGQLPMPSVLVAEGGKAVLTCSVTRPQNDSIDLILWFRGEIETALYSLDARSGPIQRAKHFPSDHLSSRAYIDITAR